MTADVLLSIQNLHAFYGEAHILQGYRSAVHAGEVVTLIGRNGAGKTTTLRSIMGIVAPRAGHITFDGFELAGLPRTRSLSVGSPMCRRSGASCPTSAWRRTSGWAGSARRAPRATAAR